jgi:hypothetical protein
MSTNEDTNNPKTDTTETDSDDLIWGKKLEAKKVDEEQQVEGKQDEEQEQDEEQNMDEEQEQAFRIVMINKSDESEDDSKKKGQKLGEKRSCPLLPRIRREQSQQPVDP